MIRTLCLNPAVDRVYQIDEFVAGRQYRGNNPSCSAGGKGINVARVCALLREPVAVYGFVGGENGRLVTEEIRQWGCVDRFIQVRGETRVTINVVDNVRKKETEIIEAGNAVDDADVQQLLALLEADIVAGDLVICSGIVIAGMALDIYRRVSELCDCAGAQCYLDTNGQHLKESIGGHYALFKPNRQELLSLLDMPDTRDIDTLVCSARKTLSLGMDSVLLSLGKHGILYLDVHKA